MNTANDILELELGDNFETEEDRYIVMQRVINDGTGWRMQGAFGRSMMDAIKAGRCMLGPEPRNDYYGNLIPSRTMVKNGTFGSKLYVSRLFGRAYANRLAKVD